MQRGSWMGPFDTWNLELKRPAAGLTRRQMVGGMAAVGLGSVAISLVPVYADPNVETAIRQEIILNATPSRVYDALTDEKRFSAFSGGSAVISHEIGGEFKLFGALQGIRGITGRNVELVPHKRIVQAWRANSWPLGVYSIVRFELTAEGSGTRLSFEQASFGPIPPTSAWDQMYWRPLKRYLDA